MSEDGGEETREGHVMCRAMMVDVGRVRRRDGRLDQLTLDQRRRCDPDTFRDRGSLSLGGRLTLGGRLIRKEGVAVAAVVAEAVVAAAVAVVENVRVGAFALDLMIV